MKKVIVTGANGFIGTNLCKELTSCGYEVIAVIRNEDENIDQICNLPGLSVVYCDLSNFLHLSDLIKERDVDVFYHLAWVGSAGQLRGDYNVQLNNIKYTCDTVKACHDLNCKRFVFASSIMEYEIRSMMDQDIVPSINTIYSSAKLSANYMAKTIANALGVEYIRTVISNIYGPGETSPRLINSSIRKLINGEHCSFSSGTQIYDFIYISDAAEAFISVGEKGINNKTYYIGSLKPRPLRDFLLELRDVVAPGIEIGLGELPFAGISLSYNEFDLNAVKNDTGFIPVVTFADGIKRTYQWIRDGK